jgi:hypothetical protein
MVPTWVRGSAHERSTDLLPRDANAELRCQLGLLRDVLGLHNVHTEVGWSNLPPTVGRSDFVEVFGPEHATASVFPVEVRDGVVVAFAVDDVVGAREELAAANAELIGDLVWANDLSTTRTWRASAGSSSAGPTGTSMPCNRTPGRKQTDGSGHVLSPTPHRARPPTAA